MNAWDRDTTEADQAAFIAHVRANLPRVGLTAIELASALGVQGDRMVPGRLVQLTEREGLRA